VTFAIPIKKAEAALAMTGAAPIFPAAQTGNTIDAQYLPPLAV